MDEIRYDEQRNNSTDDTDIFGVFEADDDVFTRARQGNKKGNRTRYLKDRLTPGQAHEWVVAGNNTGIALGQSYNDGKLLLLDDERGCLPPGVVSLVEPATVGEWTSPHGGYNRLVMADRDAYALLRAGPKSLHDVTEEDGIDVEILVSGHGLAPPSRIDHGECNHTKPCGGVGPVRSEPITLTAGGVLRVEIRVPGTYDLLDTNPDARTLTRAEAMAVYGLLGVEDPLSTGGDNTRIGEGFEPEEWVRDVVAELPDSDDDLVGEGKATVRRLEEEGRGVPFMFLRQRLRGKPGELRELRERCAQASGRTWAGILEFETLYTIFGEMRRRSHSKKQAWRLTCTVYTAAVRQCPKTECGASRVMWLEDDERRARVVQAISSTFDPGSHQRFLNRTDGRRRGSSRPERPAPGGYNRGPSFVNLQMAKLALDVLARNYDPWGETPEQVREQLIIEYEIDVPRKYVEDRLGDDVYSPLSITKCSPPSEGEQHRFVDVEYPTRAEWFAEYQNLGGEYTEDAFRNHITNTLRESGEVVYSKKASENIHVYHPVELPVPTDADEL